MLTGSLTSVLEARGFQGVPSASLRCQQVRRVYQKESTGPREVYSLTQKKESVNKQMSISMTVTGLK